MYKTIVVVDTDDTELQSRFEKDPVLLIISFQRYLTDYPKLNEPKTRVINLCDTAHYLSKGYYCSLLAEARQHKVLPSVKTVNDLRDSGQDHADKLLFGTGLADILGDSPKELLVFFSWAEEERYQKLARKIFDIYPAPILKISLRREKNNILFKVKHCAFVELNAEEQLLFIQRLELFTTKTWRVPFSKKQHRWDMAILVNPDEPHPPSNKEAISRFIRAAAKVGIHAETITAQNMQQLSQFDALFIRETTAIDHHTYRMAIRAEQEGLVVIDDPTSILRCCNKVFLHDAFTYNHVPSLRTRVLASSTPQDIDEVESYFDYPMVLKLPQGSFSKGVYKINDRKELEAKLTQLFSNTALVLVQEYLYTDFDWRVGVLNGRAIYACRYHMAQNHWQIYNHDVKQNLSGAYETLPTFEIPKSVLDAAVKSANVIGKGLYGVDIKQKGHQVYVIEVNDNPNLDHPVEDAYLGNELYMLIMSEFARRLEQRGR